MRASVHASQPLSPRRVRNVWRDHAGHHHDSSNYSIIAFCLAEGVVGGEEMS
jgi:hypothetical protein